MAKRMTEEQQEFIKLHYEEYSVTYFAKKFDLTYQAVYNFCERECLPQKLIRNVSSENAPHKGRHLPNEYGKEVLPDPPRKWKRPPATYSNLQRDELIDKILNQ